MSRKHPSDIPASPFKRLLGWTLLLALVFSAGLITGERLLRKETLAGLVAVDDQVVEIDEEVDVKREDDKPRSFAFFDQLSSKAKVSLSSTRNAAAPKVEEKPANKEDTAKQEAPAKQPAAKPEAAAKPKAPARYTLQVAAHPDLDGAKAHMERLRGMGLEPQLVSAAIPGKGTFYRVRVGKFATTKEAQAFQEKLKSKNSLSTFVSPL